MVDNVRDFFEDIDFENEDFEKFLIFEIYYGGDFLDVLGFSDILDNEYEEMIVGEGFLKEFEGVEEMVSVGFFVFMGKVEKEDILKESKFD